MAKRRTSRAQRLRDENCVDRMSEGQLQCTQALFSDTFGCVEITGLQ